MWEKPQFIGSCPELLGKWGCITASPEKGGVKIQGKSAVCKACLEGDMTLSQGHSLAQQVFKQPVQWSPKHLTLLWIPCLRLCISSQRACGSNLYKSALRAESRWRKLVGHWRSIKDSNQVQKDPNSLPVHIFFITGISPQICSGV